MNKLITTIATIALCGFFSTLLATPADAAAKKSHRHSYHKSHKSHKSQHHKSSRRGVASWYGPKFHGKKTATGERYNMYAMTAAHKTLPLSSYARVTNLKNKKTVIVRINDRGPYYGNRVMDLSYAAAKRLGMKKAGTAPVQITPMNELSAMAQMQDQPG